MNYDQRFDTIKNVHNLKGFAKKIGIPIGFSYQNLN
jgi:hypothetical protein